MCKMRRKPKACLHLHLTEAHHWSRSLLPGIIAAVRGTDGLRVMNHGGKPFQEIYQESRGERMGFLGMFVESEDEDFLDELNRHQIPVMNISGRNPPKRIPSVIHDDVEIGRMAATHLLQPGRQRFAYLGLAHSRLSELRQKGYCDELARHGFPCEVYQETQGGMPMLTWLKRLSFPAAVFTATDSRARALCSRMEHLDVTMPEEMTLLGVDNDPFLCDLHLTSLSSIQLDFFGLGYRAGKLMRDWMMKGERPPNQEEHIPPLHVETRMSSDPWHTGDPLLRKALLFMKDPVAGVNSVTVLSRQLGVSRRSLELRCKSEFDQSPLQILNSLKLERAYYLLHDSELELTDVMHRVGFRDQRHFRRLFRSRFGRGPTEIRRGPI